MLWAVAGREAAIKDAASAVADAMRTSLRSIIICLVSTSSNNAEIRKRRIDPTQMTGAVARACTHKSRSTSDGCPMSALPPKADIADHDWHVRFVPKADILRCV